MSTRQEIQKLNEARTVALALQRHAKCYLDEEWYKRTWGKAHEAVSKALDDLHRVEAYLENAEERLVAATRQIEQCDAALQRIEVQPKVDKAAKLKARIAELEAQLAEAQGV